jgi:DNA-3-methyladenine glycosylase II
MTLSIHTVAGRLTPAAPFDFAQTLRFAEDFTPARGEQRVAENTLTKAIMVAGRPIGFHITSVGTVDAPALDYTLYGAQPFTPDRPDLINASEDRLRFYLSLDDDLTPFYQIASADSAMSPIIARRYGLHQLKFPTPFENAAWAILTQRTPIAVARVIKDRLTQRYGGSVQVKVRVAGQIADEPEGETLWVFPDAPSLVAADPDELASLIRNERKTAYLTAASQAFADVDEQWLRTGDYDEVEAWLRAIPGVGAWSAGFILIRGLGRVERVTPNEPLLEAAARAYGEPITPACFKELATRYGDTAGYWAFYLHTGT